MSVDLSLYGTQAGDAATRTARVDEVARLLGLQEILDNRVGGQFQRGISGGQVRDPIVGLATECVVRPLHTHNMAFEGEFRQASRLFGFSMLAVLSQNGTRTTQ